MTGGAEISDGGLYRYRLWRDWDASLGRVVWIMLNPSTADATDDDPTIRKCCGFARKWGFGGIEVVNLFALRSSNPVDLVDSYEAGIDPVGPCNDKAIYGSASHGVAIAAWGAFQWEQAEYRVSVVRKFVGQLRCLRTTKTGAPGHPLYVPYSAVPLPWPALKARA